MMSNKNEVSVLQALSRTMSAVAAARRDAAARCRPGRGGARRFLRAAGAPVPRTRRTRRCCDALADRPAARRRGDATSRAPGGASSRPPRSWMRRPPPRSTRRSSSASARPRCRSTRASTRGAPLPMDHPRVRISRDLAALGLARRGRRRASRRTTSPRLFEAMRVLVAGGAGREPATRRGAEALLRDAPAARRGARSSRRCEGVAEANYYRKRRRRRRGVRRRSNTSRSSWVERAVIRSTRRRDMKTKQAE